MEPNLPAGFSSRPIDDADIPAILAILNADAIAITGESEYFAEEYLADLNEPGFDRAADARAVFDARGAIVAVAEAHFSAPFVRNHGFARVAQAARGQGLGSALTAWLEARLLQRAPEAQPDAAIMLECWAYAAMDDARQLLEDHGFDVRRVFQRMEITMEAPPPALGAPEGIVIASLAERPDISLRAVHDATRESFSDHYGFVERDYDDAFVEWEYDLTNKGFDPGLKFVALEGDQVAGVSLCMPPVPGEFDLGWVHQLGVRRPWRRRGLALALLQHTFRTFWARDVARVGLAVDADSLTGATRLYEKVGMRTTSAALSYHKVVRPGRDLVRRTLDAT